MLLLKRGDDVGTLNVGLRVDEIETVDINAAADKVRTLLAGTGIKFKLTEFSYRE